MMEEDVTRIINQVLATRFQESHRAPLGDTYSIIAVVLYIKKVMRTAIPQLNVIIGTEHSSIMILIIISER